MDLCDDDDLVPLAQRLEARKNLQGGGNDARLAVVPVPTAQQCINLSAEAPSSDGASGGLVGAMTRCAIDTCLLCDGQLMPAGPRGTCAECNMVSHLACLARRIVPKTGGAAAGTSSLVPSDGSCPLCGGTMRWADVARRAMPLVGSAAALSAPPLPAPPSSVPPPAAAAVALPRLPPRFARGARQPRRTRKEGCRRCGGSVPPPKRSWCSAECIHEHRITTDRRYARSCMEKRDRGVCAKCGEDCVALRRKVNSIIPESARAAMFAGLPAHRLQDDSLSLWDMDHTRPVAGGGGACGLDNLRTLCLPCHGRKTAREAGERARARRAAKAATLAL